MEFSSSYAYKFRNFTCDFVRVGFRGFFIAGTITAPLQKFLNVFGSLSKGKISKVNIEQKDEVGKIAEVWNIASEEITKVISEVVKFAGTLKEISEKIYREVGNIFTTSG